MDYYGTYTKDHKYYSDRTKPRDRVSMDPYTYPGNLEMALELMKDAVEKEQEKMQYYDYVIKEAPSEEDKRILMRIRKTEVKHLEMFKQLYCELTGYTLPTSSHRKRYDRPKSYCDGIKEGLFDQINAVDLYTKILFALQDRVHINMLTEIITDELKHADYFNFLYSKNACFEEENRWRN